MEYVYEEKKSVISHRTPTTEQTTPMSAGRTNDDEIVRNRN